MTIETKLIILKTLELYWHWPKSHNMLIEFTLKFNVHAYAWDMIHMTNGVVLWIPKNKSLMVIIRKFMLLLFWEQSSCYSKYKIELTNLFIINYRKNNFNIHLQGSWITKNYKFYVVKIVVSFPRPRMALGSVQGVQMNP